MVAAAATTAMLPPRAATVAMKTPAVTVLGGAQATINNQLQVVATRVTETVTVTATTMRMKTKAKAKAAAA